MFVLFLMPHVLSVNSVHSWSLLFENELRKFQNEDIPPLAISHLRHVIKDFGNSSGEH